MTNTPLSEREKELVEAVRSYFPLGGYVQVKTAADRDKINRIVDALRAYKPEKEYTMPAWEEFTRGKKVMRANGPWPDCVDLNTFAVAQPQYNAIREALSKPKAPTE